MKDNDSAVSFGDFAELGLDGRLVEAITALGYEEPTPIQREAIPPLLAGRDLIGQAATGTGKTAAFALPILQRISALGKDRGTPSALILVPTRELAMQVAEATHRYGRAFSAHVLPIYGGQSFGQQLSSLKRGVDVIVATPGRALDHIRRGTIKLDHVAMVVLDEADEMLDMGFAEDIEAILAETPTERQTMLFSVTLPPRIQAIARRHLNDPIEIKVARERVAAGKAPRVRQTAYVVARAYKSAALGRVLDLENPTSALVFCRTRLEVDELTETLVARGYRAEALHGGMAQEHRERVMAKLRAGGVELVIATDVAARGLDIEQLSHVFNYDVPSAPDSYINRIGRVGRAGRKGVAITLAEPREHRLMLNIEYVTKQKIEIASLPSIADLRARRLEITRSAIHETLIAGDLEHVRVVVEALIEEYDIMEIALAAVKLAHQSTVGAAEDEDEIPAARIYSDKPSWKDRASRPGRGDRFERGPRKAQFESGGGKPRDFSPSVEGKPRDFVPPKEGKPGKRKDRKAKPDENMVRLRIDVGRDVNVRPQDLVGAIANEAGIPGRAVGSIDITDSYSIVEVAEDLAGLVVAKLKGKWIRGKKVKVQLEK